MVSLSARVFAPTALTDQPAVVSITVTGWDKLVLKPTPWPGGKVQILATEQQHKESRQEFEALDRNCNTCKHLVRVPHKDSFGFLKGMCGRMNGHPFQPTFLFHPHDWMGMSCWESRR